MSLVNAFLLLGNWFWIEERKSVPLQLQTLFELMAILKLIFKTYTTNSLASQMIKIPRVI